MRLALLVGTPAAWFVATIGEMQIPVIRETQPMKAAVLEGGDVAQVQARLVKEYGPGDYVFAHDWLRLSMDSMKIIGYTVSSITIIAVILLWKGRLWRWRPFAYVMIAMIPFPFIASVGGWVLREMGRQPWIIYGELTVEDALSNVSRTSLAVSCTVFIVIFLALAVTNWTLITRFARRGPDATQLGDTEPLPEDVPEGGADEKQTVPAF
jgi:cytochrome d ubiquinol oxidase subunit I